jgi:phosphate starvation-inducible protein PhoH
MALFDITKEHMQARAVDMWNSSTTEAVGVIGNTDDGLDELMRRTKFGYFAAMNDVPLTISASHALRPEAIKTVAAFLRDWADELEGVGNG